MPLNPLLANAAIQDAVKDAVAPMKKGALQDQANKLAAYVGKDMADNIAGMSGLEATTALTEALQAQSCVRATPDPASKMKLMTAHSEKWNEFVQDTKKHLQDVANGKNPQERATVLSSAEKVFGPTASQSINELWSGGTDSMNKLTHIIDPAIADAYREALRNPPPEAKGRNDTCTVPAAKPSMIR